MKSKNDPADSATGGTVPKDGRASRGRTKSGVRVVHRAIDDVRYIRDLIDMSYNFFVSGWSGVAAGIITIVGVALTAWIIDHPGRWGITTTLWMLWIIIGLVLMVSDIFFFVKRSGELGRPVFSGLLVKIGLTEVLMMVQGLVLTLLLIRIEAPEYIPAAWLLTFGTTFTLIGLFIPGGLWVLGLASLFASIAAFIVPSGGLWCAGFVGASMCIWGAAYLVVRGR